MVIKDHRPTHAPVSRAYFKLLEALSRARVPLAHDWDIADIGAAPGGWTQVLSRALASARTDPQAESEPAGSAECQWGHVHAIDPGALTLAPLPDNVTHLAQKAEEAHEALAGLLGPSRRLRLVCSDANMHPAAVVRLAAGLLPVSASATTQELWWILTMKNFCKGSMEFAEHIASAEAAVRAHGFTEVHVAHLFANCRDEQTLWARRAPCALALAAE